MKEALLHIAASIAVVISFGGAHDTAFAGDEPKTTVARPSQVDPLEVPGSFKDLSDAKDPVTAKRSPEQITLPAATGAGPSHLSIDAEKVTATRNTRGLAAVGGGGVTAPRLSIDAENVSAGRRAAGGGGVTAPRLSIDAESVAGTADAAYTESDLVDFDATAYCLKGRTASGINTRPGVIAADPRVLPMGTVIHLRAGQYTGTYTVMDTGSRIRGRRVDVYVPTHREAVEFGRRQVKIKVIGQGSGKAARTNKNPVVSER